MVNNLSVKKRSLLVAQIFLRNKNNVLFQLKYGVRNRGNLHHALANFVLVAIYFRSNYENHRDLRFKSILRIGFSKFEILKYPSIIT